jgi:hypothetical protein
MGFVQAYKGAGMERRPSSQDTVAGDTDAAAVQSVVQALKLAVPGARQPPPLPEGESTGYEQPSTR